MKSAPGSGRSAKGDPREEEFVPKRVWASMAREKKARGS